MIRTRDLMSLDKCIVDLSKFADEEPWKILPEIKGMASDFISKIITGKEDLLDENRACTLVGDWIVCYKNEDNITIVHESAEVINSFYYEGKNIIGPNCVIRPDVYLRGNVIVSEGCVLGNSCEFKNCILSEGCQVPHFSYVGDSVLGYKSHLGAGAKISNLKLDGTNVKINGEDIGLRKCGAFLGDEAQIGCNAVLNPGTIVGKNSIVYPCVSFRGVLGDNEILKDVHMEKVKRSRTGKDKDKDLDYSWVLNTLER